MYVHEKAGWPAVRYYRLIGVQKDNVAVGAYQFF